MVFRRFMFTASMGNGCRRSPSNGFDVWRRFSARNCYGAHTESRSIIRRSRLSSLLLRALPLGLVMEACFMAQMLGHFGFQRALNQILGQLLQQAVFAHQLFRFLIAKYREIRRRWFWLRPFFSFPGKKVSCLIAVYIKILTPSDVLFYSPISSARTSVYAVFDFGFVAFA